MSKHIDGGHWYERDGTPRYSVPKKDGSGDRPTTLADARKLGLLPSVTTILKCIDKPALTEWKVRQAVMAVCTAPDVPGEGIDAKISRVLDTECQQDSESQAARDRGTELHQAMEDLFNGKDIAAELRPWVIPAFNAVSSLGKPVATEKVVVGNGYAGKVDLIQQQQDSLVLWDWKTCKKLPDPTKGAWLEHRLQLSAYAKAYERDVRCYAGNVYVSTTEPGAYVICEHDYWQSTFVYGFHPLLMYWQWANDYRP